MSLLVGCSGPDSLFLCILVCSGTVAMIVSCLYKASSVTHAIPITCQPSPPTLLSFYPPATLWSSDGKNKRPPLILKHVLPLYVCLYVCVAWPTFFSDRMWVCLSDCSLEPCSLANRKPGTSRWRANCLLSVRKNASGVNGNIFLFFFSFTELSPACFRSVIILVILWHHRAKNSALCWIHGAKGIKSSTPPLLFWTKENVLIIAANYFPVASCCFVRAQSKKSAARLQMVWM